MHANNFFYLGETDVLVESVENMRDGKIIESYLPKYAVNPM